MTHATCESDALRAGATDDWTLRVVDRAAVASAVTRRRINPCEEDAQPDSDAEERHYFEEMGHEAA
jgi:hypothetical protein